MTEESREVLEEGNPAKVEKQTLALLRGASSEMVMNLVFCLLLIVSLRPHPTHTHRCIKGETQLRLHFTDVE